MMYELSKSTMYAGELMEEQMKQTNNTGLLQVAEQESFDFEKDILAPLFASAGSEKEFRTLMSTLYDKREIESDDYTLVVL